MKRITLTLALLCLAAVRLRSPKDQASQPAPSPAVKPTTVSLLPPPMAPRTASLVPSVPLRHILLAWDASDPGTIYRVRGSNTLAKPFTWPVLRVTNGLSFIWSNDLRPGPFYFRVTSSNANSGWETPIKAKL